MSKNKRWQAFSGRTRNELIERVFWAVRASVQSLWSGRGMVTLRSWEDTVVTSSSNWVQQKVLRNVGVPHGPMKLIH